MILKTLAEDTSQCGMPAEHGLCLYIETEMHKILFDVGQSALFLKNARTLDVSVKDVDLAVISHGHYDHGGGLAAFLEENDSAPVYIQKSAFEPHFAMRAQGLEYIGLDADLLRTHEDRFVLTDGDLVINDTAELMADVPAIDPLPEGNRLLWAAARSGDRPEYSDRSAGYVPDTFGHEQNLVLSSGGKTFLFTGCAHRGISNIVRRFREKYSKTADFVIGGFHLTDPSDGIVSPEYEAGIARTAEILTSCAGSCITGHCTGNVAGRLLRENTGGSAGRLSAGTVGLSANGNAGLSGADRIDHLSTGDVRVFPES